MCKLSISKLTLVLGLVWHSRSLMGQIETYLWLGVGDEVGSAASAQAATANKPSYHSPLTP